MDSQKPNGWNYQANDKQYRGFLTAKATDEEIKKFKRTIDVRGQVSLFREDRVKATASEMSFCAA
jgi:hypothetical protein